MAERRMFAKSVVESARFLKMPASSQNLYFHLGMNADDDGVVEAYSVINLIKANEDDLKILFGKGFVKILNEDLVTFITDWREQNRIRADRKKDSIYVNLLLQTVPEVELLECRTRSDTKKKARQSVVVRLSASGQSMDNQTTAQCSVVKDSAGKYSGEECSEVIPDTHIKYQLDNEILTVADYEKLVVAFDRPTVEGVIRRILEKPYHGCLNASRISSWCAEQRNDGYRPAAENRSSVHSEQLLKLAKERVTEK